MPMSTTREIVGLLKDRARFDDAVAALAGAGFEHADISVLTSHAPLEVARPKPKFGERVVEAVTGELVYAFPLATAGIIAVAGGPIVEVLAGLTAAGIGVAAVVDYIKTITAHPDPAEFARAVEAGGVVLWVRVADGDAEARARAALKGAGAANIHLVERKTEAA